MLLLAKSGNNWSVMFGQFFFLIVVFIGILLLAYYSTKLIARSRMGSAKGRNMRIIEGLGVGMQGSIQLIRVADKYYLIGVAKDRITFLTEVDSDKIEENNRQEIDFSDILQKIRKRYGKK